MLRPLVALLGQVDLVRLLVHREVAGLITPSPVRGSASPSWRFSCGTSALMARYMRGVVFGLAADDQRRARLVDQDRVHLVHDGVVQAALHPVGGLVDHVVAQVVEAVLVVGAVGDVGRVGGLLLFSRCICGRLMPTLRPRKLYSRPIHCASRLAR
jgi:hypothetical protein